MDISHELYLKFLFICLMLFKVYNRYYSCSSDARVRRNLWYLLILELCLFISFTVLWMSCGVMFISSIGMESLLGGGIGLELVVGVADSVLAVVCGARGTISQENLASRVCNLLDTRSLTLKRSFFLSLKILTIGLNRFMLERTL